MVHHAVRWDSLLTSSCRCDGSWAAQPGASRVLSLHQARAHVLQPMPPAGRHGFDGGRGGRGGRGGGAYQQRERSFGWESFVSGGDAPQPQPQFVQRSEAGGGAKRKQPEGEGGSDAVHAASEAAAAALRGTSGAAEASAEPPH